MAAVSVEIVTDPPVAVDKDKVPVPAVALDLEGTGRFPIRDHAHAQIAAHTGIPKQYYDRMRKEAPVLLSDNIDVARIKVKSAKADWDRLKKRR
mgnify:CR=1 FL=1